MAPDRAEHRGAQRAGRPIGDESVWRAADWPDDRSWVVDIPAAVADDLARALPALHDRALAFRDIRAADVPLPNGMDFVQAVEQRIESGAGFALLGGFPVDRFDYEDLALAYAGLMCHFGNIAVQNRAGEYVIDVMDKGRGYGQQSRGHYSNDHLAFHADGATAVSLLCLQTAASGGRSLLVSGAAVYNAVLRERPDHLPVLLRGFHHHRREERAPGDAAVTPWRTPVFSFYGGRFHMAYVRPSIDFCESEGVVLAAEEKAALDFLDSIIARPEMQVTMELRRGDLQIVNNFLVLHARTGYVDDPMRPRHLIRLWLDNPRSLRNGPGKTDWYLPAHSRFLRERGHLLEGYEGEDQWQSPPTLPQWPGSASTGGRG